MKTEFITPQDTRWRNMLKKTAHDFYHLPEYIKFAAKFEGGEPVAFYAENEGQESAFLIPLLIRSLPEELGDHSGWRDMVTPYGYPTPIMLYSNSETPQSNLLQFLHSFVTSCRDNKILSVFIRLHPLLTLNLDDLSQLGIVIHHGQTVYIDLSQPEEILWRDTRKGHRQDIVKLETSKFDVHHNYWEEFDAFVDIYQATMEELNAASFYRYPKSYFQEIRLALSENLHLFTVVSPTHEICAGGLFVVTNNIVEYHLSGTHSAYRRNAPTKLMLHAVRQWSKAAGSQFFHLGGGLGASNDTLFAFKAGFSRHRAEFNSFRIIIDNIEYDRLTQRKFRICAPEVSPGDYFPAYRYPG